MKVNIRKISERTGFSPATVSNALNHKRGVNKNTAAEILKTAKEMGYVMESGITKIKLVIYRDRGLIVGDTPFFALVVDGFEKACREAGYEMVLFYLDRRSEDYGKQVENLLLDNSTAIVLYGSELTDDEAAVFRKAKTPFLVLDYWNHDMSFNGVFINNADAARMAGEYLIKKGHTKIGYLRGNYRIKAFGSRYVGLQIALSKHGLEMRPEYVVTLPVTMEEAYQEMLHYLKSNPKLPTAFFADNDNMALGAMQALKEAGFRVPQDVSLIGFDDLPFCEIAVPRLTSLRVPKQEMGRLAVREIVDMIQGKNMTKTKIQICTEFMERDSVWDLNGR
ncbi:MAG TPA: LacI family DNA-binding transcriptional regulator [Candidatus Blautia pullicola]|uniref:LacI family DNA-binding transcriptional regulator n=1 Tax=Candidatus Blautia pullicola TaxID=2838498 RepID=A0A9D2FQC9_9FIRM|nr:LacI family DNA-binding transcriptional regulator [Candidatus Blautia pullicola]